MKRSLNPRLRQHLHAFLKYLFLLAALIAIYTGLLVCAALIPRAAIQDNLEASADYLCGRSVFFTAFGPDKGSMIDRYADSILLNIACSYDSGQPLLSVMRSAYYHTDTENENVNLQTAVYQEVTPTYDYLRYWHGSIILVRPLLVFLNLRQIYILNAVILSLLLASQCICTRKKYNPQVLFCFIFSLFSVSVWYVPMSLEYTWCFLIMSVSSILAAGLDFKKIPVFFFIIGSVTAFCDFLTAETITLLIPLIFLLLRAKESRTVCSYKSAVRFAVKPCLVWGSGYASTVLSKWMLASVILHKNAFAESLDYAAYRISGDSSYAPGFAQRILAIPRNISCIFPFSLFGNHAGAAFLILLLLLLMAFYLLRKENGEGWFWAALFTLALLPLLRFIVLANHSYLHYFFTFRAMLASILCITIAVSSGIDTKLLKKGR